VGIQSVAKRNHAAEVPPPDKAALRDDARVRRAARLILSILVAGLALWVARGFMYPLAWAAVIAIATWPAYIRFRALIFPRPSQLMAPLLFTVLVGAVLVVPVILTVHQVAQGSDALVQWIGELRRNGIPIPSWVTRLPIASEYLVAWWRANLGDPQAALAGLRHVNLESLTAWTSALSGELLQRLAVFLLTLVALFFLLRDGAFIAEAVVETADRLLGDRGERLAGKIANAVRSTVNGTVVVAVAPGALIGIAYVVAGVPNPLLFVLLTIAFGMLPFGAWAVFSLAALVLLAQGGSPLAAVFVFGAGAATMVAAGFMWPVLVGRTARLPFLLALIGIFGGLQAFGLIGLFVGPVIMVALLTIWREWYWRPPSSLGPQ
jgi:predicted PurR-regulated permease PerM